MSQVSRREAEVLGLLGAQLSNAQIARQLHISIRTVESHISSLLRKYGVASRSELPASAPVSDHVAGLPSARSTFVGRTGEREAIAEALRDERLVTLLGPGGVGKTRLATAVDFPYGGAFVDLVPVRDGYVVEAVAAVLGVAESPQQPLIRSVAHRLGSGRTLLILDNCEHLVDRVAEFASDMLARCPELTILATSRERLAVPGERIVRVSPLASDAELLFLDRARAVDPAFDADQDVVAALCARLDGMPLAIELAAARATVLGADGLLAGLEDSLRLLAGVRGTHERHRSLRDVIGWSHELLDKDERTLFRRLALFVGAFDLRAAAEVGTAGDHGAAADVLGRLADKSMVVHQRGAVSRWRMLETIRAFAAEQLSSSGEAEQVAEWRLRWATRTARDLEGRLGGEWRAEFDLVADDLRAARADHAVARSLGNLTYNRRFLVESAGHFRDAARLAPTPQEAAEDLRKAADTNLLVTNSQTRTFDLLLEAAELADTPAVLLARAVEVANRFHAVHEEIPRERLDRLLDRARDLADPAAEASLAVAAAWEAGATWHSPSAELADQAVTLARTAGDAVLISAALDAASAAATRAGRLKHAHALSTERLDLLEHLSRQDPAAGMEIADTLHMAVTYAIACGDLPAADSAAHLLVGDELAGTDPFSATGKLIAVLVLTGRLEEAVEAAPEMWSGWERSGRPAAPALVPGGVLPVALAYGLLGDPGAAALWRDRALEVLGVTDFAQAPGVAPFAAFVDARIAVHTGAFPEGLIERAFASYPLSRHESYARAAAAELAVVANHPDAAAYLEAAAPSARENDWAAACLARAHGRLHGDEAALATSAAIWKRLNAAFELAETQISRAGQEP